MGTVFENRLATARSASPRHGLKDMIPGTASTQLTRWLSEEVDRVAAPAAKCTWCVGLSRRGAGVVGVVAPPRANQTFVADQVRNDNGTVYKQK